ncbi:hypothetical protein GCM10028858_16790 [Halorubrum pallidum]
MVEQVDDGFDSTTRIRIEPTPDRDARWVVSVRYALADEAERAAFETVGDRFRNGDTGPSESLFAGFAREASRNVDRTMQISDAEREVDVHEDPSSFDVAGDDAVAVGELRLSFVWTGFLTQDGDTLVLDDALTTPDGTWLRSLEPGQTLEVTTPNGYTVTSTTVSLRDNAVVIDGPRTFDEGEGVAVVYESTGTPGPPWTMLVAAVLVGALIVAGSVLGYRRRSGAGPGDDAPGDAVAATAGADDSDTTGPSTGDTGADGSAADGTGAQRDSAETESSDAPDTAGRGSPGRSDAEPAVAEPDDAAATDSGVDGPDSTDSDGSADDADGRDDDVDRSLLSDEERVEHLLDDNGGRMRQADIVSETGWSDAKVSQLLSAMADEDRVEKLRLGRENLISLPDSGTAAGGRGGDGDDQSDADDGPESGGDR